MLSAYIRQLILTYFDNIFRRVNRRQPQAGSLVEWVAENVGLLELDADALDLPSDLHSDSTVPRSGGSCSR